MTHSEHAILEARGQVDYTRKELAGYLLSCARTLTQASERLAKRPYDTYAVNCLGELQGQGPKIDVLCATFAAQCTALHNLTELCNTQKQAPSKP